MSEFLSNFHFIRPFVLLLLLLPLGFFWHYARSRGRNSSWAQVCDKNLLDFLLVKGSSVQRRLIVWIGLVGFVSAVAAAAGPSWKKKEIPNLAPENPVMILLNLSTDMAEKDLTPSRLARAKFEISDLLKMIPSAQSGLIVYSDEPFLISPLTDDARLLDNLLPRLTFDLMPGNGDRLDRALELAVEKFKNAGFPQGQIIVFTSDIGERLDLALAAAEKAKASGYPVSVAAITKADGERLRLLAQNVGGLYIPAVSADSDMQKLAERINQNREQQLKETENLRSVWEDYGYYLTLLPALCCLYFFRKGVLVLLFMLAGLQQAQAGFFLNNNQEGLKAFNNQDYAAAAAKFDRSDWKGSSLYRLGDYQKAYEAFAAGEADVLIGTQMIAKGLDFPRVTLVGAVAADTSLNAPDYRAGERTFQLITQVAGRAGRAGEKGLVILQTYEPDSPVIQLAARQDFRAFYERERVYRRRALYPPYSVILRLVASAPEAEAAAQAAQRAEERLRAFIEERGYQEDLIHMHAKEAPVIRLDGLFRYHVFLKLYARGHAGEIQAELERLAREGAPGVRMEAEVNPTNMM